MYLAKFFANLIRKHKKPSFWLLMVLSLLATELMAQNDRTELINQYQKHYTTNRPIYQSAPVTHVIPELNTITYVIDAKILNTEVTPESITGFSSNSSSSLKVEGFKASPYLALSLKRLGLGFNMDSGQTTINYSEAYSSFAYSDISKVEYRGLAIFGFLKVIDSKFYDLTLIAGGRTTNAKHVIGPVTNTVNSNTTVGSPTTYRYALQTYEAGINNEFHLLKSVTVTPWANMVRTDTASAIAQIKQYDYNGSKMNEDIIVFWKSQRTIDYGLDLAVRIKGLEVRLGGLMGTIFGSSGDSDTVKDSGYSLSLSLHTKG